MKIHLKIFLILIFISGICNAQKENPDKILDEVVKNFSKVKDYIVDIKIKVDVSFLKVPETKATLYFKEPDKVHLESENFAMLPKEGMNFSPVYLLKEKHSAFFDKDTLLNGDEVFIIKVIPLNENTDVVLTTLWIDSNKFIIRKIESTTKSNGTFTIQLEYNQDIKFPLPSEMIFSFNIGKMNISRGFSGDFEEGSDSTKEKSKTGKVVIEYSNYRVNTNIPDSVFEQKENK